MFLLHIFLSVGKCVCTSVYSIQLVKSRIMISSLKPPIFVLSKRLLTGVHLNISTVTFYTKADKIPKSADATWFLTFCYDGALCWLNQSCPNGPDDIVWDSIEVLLSNSILYFFLVKRVWWYQSWIHADKYILKNIHQISKRHRSCF